MAWLKTNAHWVGLVLLSALIVVYPGSAESGVKPTENVTSITTARSSAA